MIKTTRTETTKRLWYKALGCFPGGASGKNLPANAGDVRDAGSIPGSGRSCGGGHGKPLQLSCLENPEDRGAWRAAVHRFIWSQTRVRPLEVTDHVWPWPGINYLNSDLYFHWWLKKPFRPLSFLDGQKQTEMSAAHLPAGPQAWKEQRAWSSQAEHLLSVLPSRAFLSTAPLQCGSGMVDIWGLLQQDNPMDPEPRPERTQMTASSFWSSSWGMAFYLKKKKKSSSSSESNAEDTVTRQPQGFCEARQFVSNL